MDAALNRALKGEVQTPDVLVRMPRTDRDGWDSCTCAPHRDSEGNIVGVIGMARDGDRAAHSDSEGNLSPRRSGDTCKRRFFAAKCAGTSRNCKGFFRSINFSRYGGRVGNNIRSIGFPGNHRHP